MPRLFVGLELPESVKGRLLELQRPIPGARWQTRGQLHLTLCFIGNVEEARVPELGAAMQALTTAPFELALHGVNCFGNPRRPRNLWVGVVPETPVMVLQQEVGLRLASTGWQPEPRRFRPHITLARFHRHNRAGSVERFLDTYRELTTDVFEVKHASLFESTQEVEGSRYQVIKRFELGDGGDGGV